jgi:glycosyltransferase involved in cell wall biosynthesis
VEPLPPRLSVVVPAYEAERYLEACLDSVLAAVRACPAVSPPESRVQVIVVDDGSTVEAARVLSAYRERIELIRQPNAGSAAARNRGVAAARGEYLAFLDADDVWCRDKVRLQLAAFAADPGLEACFGLMESFHSEELDEAARARLPIASGAMPAYTPCSILVKRAAFARVGTFDTRWRVGEFVDWYARARDSGLRETLIPELVTRRRIHGANQSLQKQATRDDYARIVRASLRRRGVQPVARP